MRTSILAAALLAGALTLPAIDETLPSGVVLTAMAVEQQPAGQPPPSQSQPPPAPAQEPSAPAAQPAQNEPPPPVNVEVTQRGWVPSPTWVAIGVIGAVLLLVVVVMASRSGSNTVIRG